jgi:dihydrofolate reductase
MSQVFCDMTVSLDGFTAALNQSADAPFGEGGDALHRWMFEDADTNVAEMQAIVDAGAFIMGRHMFGPGRGEWDLSWTGWWGEDPPYHAPVFVLTHYSREPLEMQGGTTFRFVTEGIESAFERARAAAGDRNVAIAGGAATANAYLAAGHVDELRLHIAPVVLGAGERLLKDVGPLALRPVAARSTDLATHVTYRIERQ